MKSVSGLTYLRFKRATKNGGIAGDSFGCGCVYVIVPAVSRGLERAAISLRLPSRSADVLADVTMKILSIVLLVLINLQTSAQPVTRNTVLITIDGLRWQEVFRGADDAF